MTMDVMCRRDYGIFKHTADNPTSSKQEYKYNEPQSLQLQICFFCCVVLAHMFGLYFSLRNGVQASCGKLGILYCNALHWAAAVSMHICNAALCLLCYTITLHSLITKQTIGHFASLKDEL